MDICTTMKQDYNIKNIKIPFFNDANNDFFKKMGYLHLEENNNKHISMKFKTEIIKKIFCYDHYKNLPKNGWFQRCFCCNKITSETMLVRKTKRTIINYHFMFFICTCCKIDLKRYDSFHNDFMGQANIFIQKNHNRYLR